MLKTARARLNEGQPMHKVWNNTRQCYDRLVTRVRKRVLFMLDRPYSYFLTFTIANEFLDLKCSTYTRKIKEALSQASCYIINQDYGDQTDRLHFHALASFDVRIDYTTNNNCLTSIYNFGHVDVMPINRKDEKAIREYILKLTNHATKSSSAKIWYSRGWQQESVWT